MPVDEIKPEPMSTTAPGPGDGMRGNAVIAANLREYADLLESQGADGFRELAYRRAAAAIDGLDLALADILARDGRDGLIALPAIGKGIAAAIAEMTTTGRWRRLERLRGELTPEKLFQTLPGIGPRLAHSLAETTHADSLEDLEAALADPARLPGGIGRRRREALLAILAERLGRPATARRLTRVSEPDVGMLLTVDKMYRERAAAGSLRKIAPKRHNPDNKQWLPIMHARHEDWHFTALFSNTARAHDLGKTEDWVVIYYEKDDDGEGSATVVTEGRGVLAGQRVVRGREDECAILAGQTH